MTIEECIKAIQILKERELQALEEENFGLASELDAKRAVIQERAIASYPSLSAVIWAE